MSKIFKIVGNDISDGYHTFDELYEHRCLLFLNLCLTNLSKSFWRPDFEGWFCLYLETESGQISYHVPNKFKVIIENKITRDDAHIFDGHTSKDVIFRLQNEAIKK